MNAVLLNTFLTRVRKRIQEILHALQEQENGRRTAMKISDLLPSSALPGFVLQAPLLFSQTAPLVVALKRSERVSFLSVEFRIFR